MAALNQENSISAGKASWHAVFSDSAHWRLYEELL